MQTTTNLQDVRCKKNSPWRQHAATEVLVSWNIDRNIQDVLKYESHDGRQVMQADKQLIRWLWNDQSPTSRTVVHAQCHTKKCRIRSNFWRPWAPAGILATYHSFLSLPSLLLLLHFPPSLPLPYLPFSPLNLALPSSLRSAPVKSS